MKSLGNRVRAGISLTELMVSVLLLGVLVTTAYRLAGAERAALQSIRQANVALFALEGLRNRLLAELEAGRPCDGPRVRAFLADLQVPWPVRCQTVDEGTPGRPARLLRLIMVVPPTAARPGRRYIREVPLP
ncbi:MAG: hypothetical protein GX442_01550 [Candidatus Riflebacteria bacterium]|nr:hypothetical protein [Candidatus Riflebacteria bacterium]